MVKKKLALPAAVRPLLRRSRSVFTGTLLLLIFCGLQIDLSSAEPFTLFSRQAAAPLVIAGASLFLILNLVLPRAWCRFLCPTGYLLEWLRQDDPNERTQCR